MFRSLSISLLLLFFTVLIALQFQSVNLQELLRYERELMTSEPWRAFGHALLHLNFSHLLLNLVALACMYFLFAAAFESPLWLIVVLVSSALSALGMYLFNHNIEWCVGLSGGLHGLFVYAVIRSQAHWIWLLAIVLKIIDEQFHLLQQFEWSQMSAQIIDGQVVVDAHLWGAIGGLLLVLVRAIPNIRTLLEISRD